MWVDEYRGLATFIGLAGSVIGRKKLQKAVYLAQQMGFPELDQPFDYHRYGPYSDVLSAQLGELASLGAVREGESRTASGHPTYSYELTDRARQHFAAYLAEMERYRYSAEECRRALRFLEEFRLAVAQARQTAI